MRAWKKKKNLTWITVLTPHPFEAITTYESLRPLHVVKTLKYKFDV